MDVYFVLVIVIFIAAAISLLIFALQGSASTDNHDFMESKQEPIQLTMPLSPTGMEFSPSLISPYPAQPPPMGFKDFPQSASPWPPEEVAQNIDVVDIPEKPSTKTSPYPSNEELPRMPFPRQTIFHTATTSNYNSNNPSQLPIASPTVSRPNVTTYSGNEPPPPYAEVPSQRQPSARSRRNRFKDKRSSQ